MNGLNNCKSIKLAVDISWQEYFGEIYIIKESISKIYVLKDESVIFWNVLQNTNTFENLYNECILKMKDYDKNSILNELKDFLHQLESFNIIIME